MSSIWFTESAAEWIASASMDADPVRANATTFMAAMDKLAPSAATIALLPAWADMVELLGLMAFPSHVSGRGAPAHHRERLTGWYLPRMRIYIKHHHSHYLLDNIEGFSHILSGNNSWVSLTPIGKMSIGGQLVDNVDEATASRAINELLRLTDPAGDGVAVIEWDGDHFTRRIL
ncbi:hypothetical protein [Arthrobacter methylotrophus]|uniref:Uncharacterized protein n=1 Tax=Arthrobacter methylotrophus TaxID=121291 RepID=A0ABV5UNG8_9MICC